jgi:hypothetical protein
MVGVKSRAPHLPHRRTVTNRGTFVRSPAAWTSFVLLFSSCRPPLAPRESAVSSPRMCAAPELTAIPRDYGCVIRGRVSQSDVTWKLRTRWDAVASMIVREGRVTGWLLDRHRVRPYVGVRAVAQVDNEAMLVRALVSEEDLRAVVTEPFIVVDSLIPDGTTDREIVSIDSGKATVEIDFPHLFTTAGEVACEHLGLERKRIGTGTLLPPVAGDTVVRMSATVSTAARKFQVEAFRDVSLAGNPDGISGELRGPDVDPTRRLMSFRACGGTVFGTVAKSDILGPAAEGRGTTFRCPSTGESHLSAPAMAAGEMACSKDIAVFVRTATLEDPIGVIKAGAKLKIDGDIVGETELISLGEAPVVPLEFAHFSVRTVELKSCHALNE